MENDVFSGFVKVLFEGESDEDIISEKFFKSPNDSEEEASTSASMAQNSSNTSMPTRSGVAPSSSSSAPSELPQQKDVPQNMTAPEREAKAPLAVPELKSPRPTPKTPRVGDGGGIADSKTTRLTTSSRGTNLGSSISTLPDASHTKSDAQENYENPPSISRQPVAATHGAIARVNSAIKEIAQQFFALKLLSTGKIIFIKRWTILRCYQ